MRETGTQKYNLILAGCGKMGSAMAQGWLAADIVKNLTVLDPAPLPPILQNNTVHHIEDIASLSSESLKADAVIMAVKPQIIGSVCESIQHVLDPDSVIISIAAGTPISLFESIFGANQPIIRSMPNTPAAIGQGITAAIANTATSSAQKDMATDLLEQSGALIWVEEEEQFHGITALSGSGPAYIFYIIETLTKAGTSIGLPEDLSETLARQTVIGSAALAEKESTTSAAQLRENVTSPGGTTQAALDVLMDGRLEDIYKRALEAAQNRSRELAFGDA